MPPCYTFPCGGTHLFKDTELHEKMSQKKVKPGSKETCAITRKEQRGTEKNFIPPVL